MNKIKKLLTNNTISYICAIFGLILTIFALFKRDSILSILGLILIYTNLSDISTNENSKAIKELQKEIKILKGESNDRN
jgi:uncharacterized membrane protein